ncbi:MAG: hypothetical protein PHE84_10195 [bacterium]|nr:hypothetical protein [bacterium]
MDLPLITNVIFVAFFITLAAIFFRISTQINSKGFLLLSLSSLFSIFITLLIPGDFDLLQVFESICEFIFTAGMIVLTTMENEKILYVFDLIKKKKMKDLLFKKAPQMIELNGREKSKKYLNLLIIVGFLSLVFPLIYYLIKKEFYFDSLILILSWLVMIVFYLFKIRKE